MMGEAGRGSQCGLDRHSSLPRCVSALAIESLGSGARGRASQSLQCGTVVPAPRGVLPSPFPGPSPFWSSEGTRAHRSGPGRRCPPTARGSLRRHTCRGRPVAHPRSRPTSCTKDYPPEPGYVEKTSEEKCGKSGDQPFREAGRRDPVHVFAVHSTFVILGRSRSASELRRPGDPCQKTAAARRRRRRNALSCIFSALPRFLRHGSQGLRLAALGSALG